MVAVFKRNVAIDRCLATRNSYVQVASHDNDRLGSKTLFWPSACHFRSTRINGHSQSPSECLKRTTSSPLGLNSAPSHSHSGRTQVQYERQSILIFVMPNLSKRV